MICSKCKKDFPIELKKRHCRKCPDCYKKTVAYFHSRRNREQEKQYRRKRKYEVLSHYSDGQPKCNECNELDLRCLSIDHINDDGAGMMFYNWLKKNNYPDGFQVLCMNCQWKKRFKDEYITNNN